MKQGFRTLARMNPVQVGPVSFQDVHNRSTIGG